MPAQKIILLTDKRRAEIFVKLRASSPASLADVARLLGLSLRDALDLDTKLKEEVNLERSLNEFKHSLKHGND